MRQSITLSDDLAHRIREVQAELLLLEKRNVTFTDAMVKILTYIVHCEGPKTLADHCYTK